jgi:hypothetical protein
MGVVQTRATSSRRIQPQCMATWWGRGIAAAVTTRASNASAAADAPPARAEPAATRWAPARIVIASWIADRRAAGSAGRAPLSGLATHSGDSVNGGLGRVGSYLAPLIRRLLRILSRAVWSRGSTILICTMTM